MDKAQYAEFLTLWKQIMYVVGGASLLTSILIRIINTVRVSSIKEYKGKYDYLRNNEIRMYFLSILFFSIAVFLGLNTLEEETVLISIYWFIIRVFISACIATLIAYVGYLILKFYWPGKLQKKLDKWRYKPRTSSAGNKMQILSEAEEDVYLDPGMQAEEDVFSVDYDVWVDNKTMEIKIEKYLGYLEVLQCQSCTFQTLKLKTEEILQPATEEQEGELLKHYECSYCKSKRTTKHNIAKIIHSDKEFRLPEDFKLKSERKIKSIMVEILSNSGERVEFFFQDQVEATRFLEEFDFDKVPENQIES